MRLAALRPRLNLHLLQSHLPAKKLSSISALQQNKKYPTPATPPRPSVPESSLTEAFLKGSGPGGQKINKTSSAVQLKHLPTGIVIKSQATRSRSQNRKIARRLLAEQVEVLEKGDQSRVKVKAEKVRKKKASADKKKRRKYRDMDSQKDDTGIEDDETKGVGEEGEDGQVTEDEEEVMNKGDRMVP